MPDFSNARVFAAGKNGSPTPNCAYLDKTILA
jgi:hypothetical protein